MRNDEDDTNINIVLDVDCTVDQIDIIQRELIGTDKLSPTEKKLMKLKLQAFKIYLVHSNTDFKLMAESVFKNQCVLMAEYKGKIKVCNKQKEES